MRDSNEYFTIRHSEQLMGKREERVAQKRKYNSKRYQEMSEEKKQAIQMRSRARYQQLRTGDSSNNPIPNSTASSNVLLVPETPLQIDVGSSFPHDATEPLHGVRTSRKRIYNYANTQPPVTTQNDSEDTIQKGECNYHSNSSNPSFHGAGHDPYDF